MRHGHDTHAVQRPPPARRPTPDRTVPMGNASTQRDTPEAESRTALPIALLQELRADPSPPGCASPGHTDVPTQPRHQTRPWSCDTHIPSCDTQLADCVPHLGWGPSQLGRDLSQLANCVTQFPVCVSQLPKCATQLPECVAQPARADTHLRKGLSPTARALWKGAGGDEGSGRGKAKNGGFRRRGPQQVRDAAGALPGLPAPVKSRRGAGIERGVSTPGLALRRLARAPKGRRKLLS
jgi:hypothetical protein